MLLAFYFVIFTSQSAYLTVYSSYTLERNTYMDHQRTSGTYSSPAIFGKRAPSADALAALFCKKSSATFTNDSEARTLQLFHAMAERVPAYKAFLARNQIDPSTIKTFKDLQTVPPTDKASYLKLHTLEELSWDGIVTAHMFSTSSGSSGEAQFWPRTQLLELETATIYELLLKNFFSLDRHRTLLINAYSMGLYVAGTFTLNSCMRIADKGYPLTVVTPGISKIDVLKVIQGIGSSFDQIVLCAYPPLAKDIIDEGTAQGINWENYNMHFISGGESYSEKWRSHLYQRAGVGPQDYLFSSVNTYGSADAAILGHETPMSILIRTFASENKALCQELFGRQTVPSFHQYYPFWKNITLHEKELCFSANAGIPLLRYNIHDHGGTYTYAEVLKILKKHGFTQANINARVPAELQWHLPFVYLFGRTDAATTIYGLNIYPENIRQAIEHDHALPYLSGKFVLSTEYDRKHDQYLALKLELQGADRPTPEVSRHLKRLVYETLREINAEFKMLSDTFEKRSKPRITFHPRGDEKHFPTRIKERYLKK